MKRITPHDMRTGDVVANCDGACYAVTEVAAQFWYGRRLWLGGSSPSLAWAACHPAKGYVSLHRKGLQPPCWWLLSSEADLVAIQAHQIEHRERKNKHRAATDDLRNRYQAAVQALDAGFARSCDHCRREEEPKL